MWFLTLPQRVIDFNKHFCIEFLSSVFLFGQDLLLGKIGFREQLSKHQHTFKIMPRENKTDLSTRQN